jgi:uncharacterized DUF497 family protein
MARWEWASSKARTNRRDHKVSFELAQRVFGDPEIMSRPDPHPEEERWQSIGRPSAASEVVLLVVHTESVWQPDGEEVGRIISARKATAHERRAYEEGEF